LITHGLINSWLISQNPYQQSIADNELIVDKVVLINKEPYDILAYKVWHTDYVAEM
jgi:hypothetical protein